jgi:predicted deacetylase
MLEKAPIPFCIVSSDARPVYVNQAASRLLLSQRHKEGDPLELHGFFHECTGKPFSLEKELRRILLVLTRRESGYAALSATAQKRWVNS